MVMSGMGLRTIQQILGHSSVQVTERYAHLAPDFMAQDAEKLSLNIGTLVRPARSDGWRRPPRARIEARLEST